MRKPVIDHLPPVLRDVLEFKYLSLAEQKIFDHFHGCIDSVFNNQFIDDTDEIGIARYEKILGITPKATDLLEFRQFRVKAQLSNLLPFTMRSLEQQLTSLCGKDNFFTELVNGEYLLIVRLGLAKKENYNDVAELLQKIVPANMVIDLDLKYNTHQVLHGFTHAQLAVNTQEQLKSEVLSIGKRNNKL